MPKKPVEPYTCIIQHAFSILSTDPAVVRRLTEAFTACARRLRGPESPSGVCAGGDASLQQQALPRPRAPGVARSRLSGRWSPATHSRSA